MLDPPRSAVEALERGGRSAVAPLDQAACPQHGVHGVWGQLLVLRCERIDRGRDHDYAIAVEALPDEGLA